MTLTINQILVICLILVLTGFVVVMAVMAKHAIELLKKTKVMVGEGQNLIESSRAKVNSAGDMVINAATKVAGDTSPAVKALGAAAGGLTAINTLSFIGRGLVRRGGIVAAMAGRRERRKSKKELRKSRKLVRKMNKQAKLENKAGKKARKIVRKNARAAAKAERKAYRKAARRAAGAASKK